LRAVPSRPHTFLFLNALFANARKDFASNRWHCLHMQTTVEPRLHIDAPSAAAAEQQRLDALDRYDLLDTPQEEAFDRITRLAKHIFNVPMSTITLLDGHRQWFKSRQGIAFPETERQTSFCRLAIELPRPLIILDTHLDPRVANNPFVTGDPHLRFYAGAQLRSPEGHAIGTLCVMDDKPRAFDDAQVGVLVDLAKIVMSEIELRALAMTDSLTGALTRRAFRDEATRAMALAKRHKHAVSCIALDLDHFKTINDTHGHGVGDMVLRAAVSVCAQHTRTADVVGRIGGEEFAILLPHTDLSAAYQVAEKLRLALSNVHLQVDGKSIRFSASFGVASAEADVDVDELLRRADSVLYAAKNAGRNCCQAWRSQGSAQAGTRRRVLKGAQIAFHGGHSTIDCTVRELSDEGARLSVTSTADIPERFKLAILADQVHRACQVTARGDNHLEVAFQ
jgi:diguanylate cyclase (GGDEF)-like protein